MKLIRHGDQGKKMPGILVDETYYEYYNNISPDFKKDDFVFPILSKQLPEAQYTSTSEASANASTGA